MKAAEKNFKHIEPFSRIKLYQNLGHSFYSCKYAIYLGGNVLSTKVVHVIEDTILTSLLETQGTPIVCGDPIQAKVKPFAGQM